MFKTPRLFLIDTFGLIFRAYHARARAGAPLMRTAAGLPTEAVYIFGNMLRKLIEKHQPEYLAAVWEGRGPTFRDAIFPSYKANRDETPDDLIRQMPYIERLLEANAVPVFAEDGYEADDVIGALARQANQYDVDVYIVSSDKDLTQLVGDRVFVLNPMKSDLIYTSKAVKEFMGVEPAQIVDFLALKGDSVDNIPGAPGIGDKGARDLIATYGSVEGAIEHASEVKRKTYRESLQNNSKQILLSKKLATLAIDAPVELNLESLRASKPIVDRLRVLYKDLEFNSLLSQLAEEVSSDLATEFYTFESARTFENWIAELPADKPLSVTVQLAEAGEVDAGGIGFCTDLAEAYLLPAEYILAAKSFLENGVYPKRVHDAKSVEHALGRAGIVLAGVVDDTLLSAFLINPTRADYSLEKTAARHFGVTLEHGAAAGALITHRLGTLFSDEINRLGLRDLYERIELPLVGVLARVERAGIQLDCERLLGLSRRLKQEVEVLGGEIHMRAGEVFNINSPKQLAQVLFEKMSLPKPGRRGKTKTLSTASDVLEGLEEQNEIASKILHFRQLTKLKNTYIDTLPTLVKPLDGRLHTTFNQTGATTGRVSSVNPNLQNIPVRTELGREIRAAFRSRPEWLLVKADYSQIELRILAHLSGDTVLTDAFKKGEDIHTRTAAEVFGVPPLMVGPEERRRAKAVNFGIIYGLRPFGLSKQLKISLSDARKYIEAYFELYSGVRKFIEKSVALVRKTGYTRTMFGRLRPIPEIDSKNPNQRGFAERTAINSPIQGSAADLIKLAMIRVDRRLHETGRRSLILLQVHDELLLEAPEVEVSDLAAMVKTEMENVEKLAVPLVVDVKQGPNWRDMVAI